MPIDIARFGDHDTQTIAQSKGYFIALADSSPYKPQMYPYEIRKEDINGKVVNREATLADVVVWLADKPFIKPEPKLTVASHDKKFREGMALFEQGCDAPRDIKSPEHSGWKAAQEMRAVRVKWLESSRTICGVN